MCEWVCPCHITIYGHMEPGKGRRFRNSLCGWIKTGVGGGAPASTPYAGTCGHGKWQYRTETTPHMGEIRRSSSKYALCDMDTVAMQSIVKRPEAMHSKVNTITFYQYLALPELATFFYMVLQGM